MPQSTRHEGLTSGAGNAPGAPERGVVALSARDVTKHYFALDVGDRWRVILGRTPVRGTIRAVEEVSFEVAKGEILGLLGRNGAGKSTMLRLLGGVTRPSAGCIERSNDIGSLFELGLGGSADMTGEAFARRHLELSGITGMRADELLSDIESFSELGPFFRRPIGTYSSGMAARLYFSAATASPHAVYLIDEALSVGDEHFQRKCWARMRDRLAHGASGVFVTHDWPSVLRICRRAAIMERGRVVFEGSSQEAVRRYLAIPDDRARDALRFRDSLPASFSARSGEDTLLELPIEVLRPVSFECNFVIESLVEGTGWEIVMMGAQNFRLHAPSPRTLLRIRLPRLPIGPGRYFLHVGLVELRETADGISRQAQDARGWTRGNPLFLNVVGDTEEAFVLPRAWSIG